MSVGLAIAGATAAVGVLQGVSSLLSSNATNRYQKKQLALQEQSSYQDLIDSYYTQAENIQNLRNAADQVALAKTQEQSTIGSNYSYLDRWQAYADTTLASLASEGESNYLQLAGSWANGQVSASEAGHVGGSAALVNSQNASRVKAYTGDSMKFDTSGGLLGQTIQQQRLDLEADKQTALYNIELGNQAIDMYDEAAQSLQESITEQENTNEQIAGRLNEYYGDQEHWGGESMADAIKNAYSKYSKGRGDYAGKTEEELRAQLEEEGADSYNGRIIQGILDGIEAQKKEDAAKDDSGGDDDDSSSSGSGTTVGQWNGGRGLASIDSAVDPDDGDWPETESFKSKSSKKEKNK